MGDTRIGPRIRLRDVTVADADLFDELCRRQASDGGFNDFGLDPEPVDRAILASGPLRGDRGGVFLVERIADRAVLGNVDFHRVRHGPNPESDAWMIGIDLVPEGRGQGFGSEAQRLIADYLFETTSLD